MEHLSLNMTIIGYVCISSISLFLTFDFARTRLTTARSYIFFIEIHVCRKSATTAQQQWKTQDKIQYNIQRTNLNKNRR